MSFSSACWSPSRMRWASSTSCSTVISSSRPISWRYLSSEALSRLVIDLDIFNCLMFRSLWSYCTPHLRGTAIKVQSYKIFIPPQKISRVNFPQKKSSQSSQAPTSLFYLFLVIKALALMISGWSQASKLLAPSSTSAPPGSCQAVLPPPLRRPASTPARCRGIA